MIAFTGILLPLLSHLLGAVHVALGHIVESLHACHLGIAGYTHDSLDGEVGIVSPVSGEVIRAELVRRVLSVVRQIVGPGGDDAPVFVYIAGVAVYLAQLGSQRQHVAGLLQGHVATIDLSVGNGVCAQVVGSKGLGPAAREGVVEDRGHHGLLQFGVVHQEQGSLGIGQIDGVHATVGVILLREEEQVAVLILKQFVGSDDMAVAGRQYFGILLVATVQSVVIDALVELAAALHDVGILRAHAVEHLEDADVAAMGPVALVALVHILYVLYLVVAQHHEAGTLLRLTKIVDVAQQGHLRCFLTVDVAAAMLGHDAAVLGEVHMNLVDRTHADLSVDGRHVEVSPVNADAIALLGKDRLLDGARLAIDDALLAHQLSADGLTRLVEGLLRRGSHHQLHIVLIAIGRAYLIRDVIDRC